MSSTPSQSDIASSGRALPVEARDPAGCDVSDPTGAAAGRSEQAVSAKPPISVIILTLNEEMNVREAIESCCWCDDVHVLDSGSTDRTVEIAKEMGATVHRHAFKSFGDQRNWAIDNIETKHAWIFHLDADERFTTELVDAMAAELETDPNVAGFYIPSKTIFMDRWLKRAAGYPTYQMRLFEKSRMRFIDYGHGQREDEDAEVGSIEVPYLHYIFSKGIYDWFSRHNRYSTLEALQVVQGEGYKWTWSDLFSGKKIHRWRAWKELTYYLPLRSKLRWVSIMLVNGGILEGRAGLAYANLMAMYESMISAKLRILRRNPEFSGKTDARALPPSLPETTRQLESIKTSLGRTIAKPDRRASPRDTHDDRHVPHRADAPPASRETGQLMKEYKLDGLPEMRPESSPWSFKGKLARAAWMSVGSKLFRLSFHNWYRYRRAVLRLFGANIGQNVCIRPSVHIEIPWTLTIEDNASVGDHAILYSLGKIHIGKRATVSQYAHLCAGTHDYTDSTFKLIRSPITIGDDCWIGADAFIGPGVVVGTLTVVGARSSVYKDLPPAKVAVGNPAKVIKERELK